MTHICVGNLAIIGSDNGLSPGRRQAIIWTNAGILLIGHLGTNFSEIWIWIQTFSFKKMHFKMASAKWRPFCLSLNVLILTIEATRILYVLARPQPVRDDITYSTCIIKETLLLLNVTTNWGFSKITRQFYMTFSDVFCSVKFCIF